MALPVHPDRVSDKQKRCSKSCMIIISRAIKQVNLWDAYKNIVRNQSSLGRQDDFQISPTVVFTRFSTTNDLHVHIHEMKLQKEEEDRAEARCQEERRIETRCQKLFNGQNEPSPHNATDTPEPPLNFNKFHEGHQTRIYDDHDKNV